MLHRRYLHLFLISSLFWACGEPPPESASLTASSSEALSSADWLSILRGVPVKYAVNDYGASLRANKARLVRHLRFRKASEEEFYSVIAIAMQETQHMDARERDASKDNQGAAANFSCFNMNLDMLSRLGYDRRRGPNLNDQRYLETATDYLINGVRRFSLNGLLAFHRGGYTSWQQFVTGGQEGYRRNDIYDVQGFINCFTTIVQQLKRNPSLLSDSRRVDVYCAHK